MKTKLFKSIWLPITVLTLLTIFSGCQKEPTASFTVSSTSIEVGESVSFTNISADAANYEWDFGDENTSSTVSPTHTYNTAGTYTVTLTAFSKNEKKNDKVNKAVTVTVQTGTLTDDRDGQIYNTVKIGNQWWMAENLNIGTRIDGVLDQTDNGIIEKYCYDDLESNCDVYGGLYQWDEMMQYNPSDTGTIGTIQGICPTGWHLPTDDEWTTLTDYLGGTSVAGGKLKETGTTHWRSPNTSATNEIGFMALPGGDRYATDGSFLGLGGLGFFWSATERDSFNAWNRGLSYGNPDVYHDYVNEASGFSVRCVKD